MAIRNDHLHSSAWPGGRVHHDQGTTNQIHIYNGQTRAFISSFLVPFNGIFELSITEMIGVR